MSSKEGVTFHWGWVLASAGAGIALIVLAHLGDLAWCWPQITTGTMTNIGAAFVIAFVLFVIERRFTNSIAESVEAKVQETVRAESNAFAGRLVDLETEMSHRREATRLAQDDLVQAIDDEPTYETVSAALQRAGQIGAAGRELTVVGSKKNEWTLITFAWKPQLTYQGSGQLEETGPSRLTLTVKPMKTGPSPAMPWFETEWTSKEDAAAVALDLEAKLRYGGRLREAKTLDFTFAIQEFQRGLRLAMSQQNVVPGNEKLRGKLIELLPNSWVITSEELRNLDTGYVLKRSDSAFQFPSGRGYQAFSSPFLKDPPVPPGVDTVLWEFLVSRTRGCFGPSMPV